MAEEGDIELYTSLEILNELESVLRRERFQRRIATLDIDVEKLMKQVRLLMNIVEIELPDIPLVKEDPDDDMFLVCAKSAKASMIVSGDYHLLNIGNFENIQILKSRCTEHIEVLIRRHRLSSGHLWLRVRYFVTHCFAV